MKLTNREERGGQDNSEIEMNKVIIIFLYLIL